MMDSGATAAPALIERVKAIILKPAEEWPKIAIEATPARDIFLRYVVPLALIGPLAGFIGGQLFGTGMLFASFRPGFISALLMAVATFALGLVGVLVLTLIVDALAPRFGGQGGNQAAFRLVAYGSTASWVAGIFSLVPMLSMLGLLGLYSIYLLYLGANPVMKVPREKAGLFTLVVIVCAALINFVVVGLGSASVGLFAGSAPDSSGTVTLPGGKTIDTREMEDLGKQMEDMASGKIKPVEGARLQALLPESIGGFNRISSQTVSVGQVGSSAEGEYESADRRFTLKIVDMSAAGAFAAMGAAMGIEQSREDADGYERTTTVDGGLQIESWNRADSSGKFARTVARRFMVEAEGSAASIEDLKAAVAAVDAGDLAGLAE